MRAGSYGYTLGGAVGLAMIEADVPIDESYSLRPMYDPDMKRVKELQ